MIANIWRRWVRFWIADDPCPQRSRLDYLDGV